MLRLAFDLLVRNRLLESQLFNERTFYRAFCKDLRRARRSVTIDSPYMTMKRVDYLAPTLKSLVKRGVRVRINTRHPSCHSEYMQTQAKEASQALETIGVSLYTYNDLRHWKLAVIDGRILWEGSLNILSHGRSREIMRRLQSARLCREAIRFASR